MDFLEYREKLGIGFSDEQKFKHFKAKIFNFLGFIHNDVHSGCLEFDEYFTFCNITGTTVDSRLTAAYHSADRFRHCLDVLERHSCDLTEFLSYYMALANSIKTEKYGDWKRKNFIDAIEKMLTESHIPYEVIGENGEYFIFPKGVPELDAALISAPLDWLSAYPKSQSAWIKALKNYSNQTDENASDVADKFRKTLETFFQEFFKASRTLENCKKEYGTYLKQHGVPTEIAGNLETLLQAYTNYINNYAKHRDATSDNVLEYLMYQTGNIMRLLITLTQEDDSDAD